MSNLVILQDKVIAMINSFKENRDNKAILARNPKFIDFLNQLPNYFSHEMTREDLLRVAYVIEQIPIKKTFSFFNKITEITPAFKKEFASSLQIAEAKQTIDQFGISSLDSDKDDKAINLLNDIHKIVADNIIKTKIVNFDTKISKEIEAKLAPNLYDLSLIDSQELSLLPLIVDMDRGFSLQGIKAVGLSKEEKASKLLEFCDNDKETACLVGSLGQSVAADIFKILASVVLDNSVLQYYEDLNEYQWKFQILFSNPNFLIYQKNDEYFCKVSLSVIAIMDNSNGEIYFVNSEDGKITSAEGNGLKDINEEFKASKRFIPLIESNLLLKLDSITRKFVILENSAYLNAQESINLKSNPNIVFKDYHALKNQSYVVVGENNAPTVTYTFLQKFSLQNQPKLNNLGYEETIDQLSDKIRLDGVLVSEPDSIDRILLVQAFTQSSLTDKGSQTEYSTADLVFLCAHGKFDLLLATEFANIVSEQNNTDRLDPVNVKDAQYNFYREEGKLYLNMSLEVKELTDNKGLFYVMNPKTQQLQKLPQSMRGQYKEERDIIGSINMKYQIEEVPNGKVKLHFQEMKAELSSPGLILESNKPDLAISQSKPSNENNLQPRP